MAATRHRDRPGRADRVEVVVGPERFAPLVGSGRRRVAAPQRVVPDERADVVAEVRPVVPDLEEAARVGPLEGRAELGRPRVDRERHLHRVAEPEARRPVLVAGAERRLRVEVHVDPLARVDDGAEVGDIPARLQVEGRRQRRRLRQVERPPLDVVRDVLVEPQDARGRRRVERPRVRAVEQRDLVPLEGDLHPAEIVVGGRIPLVEIANVVRLGVEHPGVAALGEAEPVDDRAVAKVAIPLVARLVGIIAVERRAEAEVDLVRQVDIGVGWRGRRRGLGRVLRLRRILLGLRSCGDQQKRGDHPNESGAHLHTPAVNEGTGCRPGCSSRESAGGSSRTSGQSDGC